MIPWMNFTNIRHTAVVYLRRGTVNPQNSDVGAVDGAAHIQATGQGDPDVCR